MNQRLAEIAYQVLKSFRENSSYEDYRDGDDPFTDDEYQRMLDALYPMAFAAPVLQEGVQHLRLTLDVHYTYDPKRTIRPPAEICALILENVAVKAAERGELSGDLGYVVADYPYRVEQLTSEGFVQILPKSS